MILRRPVGPMALCLLLFSSLALAAAPFQDAPVELFDIRGPDGQLPISLRAAVRGPGSSAPLRRQMNQGMTALGGTAKHSRLLGLPHFLAAPSGGWRVEGSAHLPPETVARGFLARHGAIFGMTGADWDSLEFRGVSAPSGSGLRMARFGQRVGGLEVFGVDVRVLMDRSGAIHRVVGTLIGGVGEIGAPSGFQAASASFGEALRQAGIIPGGLTELSGARADERRILGIPGAIAPGTSRMVYFPVGRGALLPAWLHHAGTDEGSWLIVVEAATGTTLHRRRVRMDASTQDARFGVYVQSDGTTPADNPAPLSPSGLMPGSALQAASIGRSNVSMFAAMDLTASPDGWIADGQTLTSGNNVEARLDLNFDGVGDAGLLESSGRPQGNLDGQGRNRDFLGTTPRDFDYTPAPLGMDANGGDPPGSTPFRRGAVTSLFYVMNWFHDKVYGFGFDEASGNFQESNFGRGGQGGDPLICSAQVGSTRPTPLANNAFYVPSPDGMLSGVFMFLFDGPSPARDSALDAEIMIHEYAHGVSGRLVGNGTGLDLTPGRGLGEGWSDFYALAMLNRAASDDPDARYATGAYSAYRLAGFQNNYAYGIRRFPYSTQNFINPLTLADADATTIDLSGGWAVSPLFAGRVDPTEYHNLGEIWCVALWEVRSRLIAAAGGPDAVARGSDLALQLVTDGLKLTPSNPAWDEARDAIVTADALSFGATNEVAIWEGFAERGLGYKAIHGNGYSQVHMPVKESYRVPHLDVAGVVIEDTAGTGNGNGYLDSGEDAGLRLLIVNPWRSTANDQSGVVLLVNSLTPEVTVLTNQVSIGSVPANTINSNGVVGIQIDYEALAPGSIARFQAEIEGSTETNSVVFTVWIGGPAGPGSPRTFTQLVSDGSIPDNNPVGRTSILSISEILQIYDLDVRIDQLTHPFVSDLAGMLKAPDGRGVEVFTLRDSMSGPLGANFVNTRFDDEASSDLFAASVALAPYTGSWIPAFQSSRFGGPAQLATFDGLNTLGDWRLTVADAVSQDSGTLGSWSLIVTPMLFTSAPPNVAAFVVDDVMVSEGDAGEVFVSVPVRLPVVATNDWMIQASTVEDTATTGGDYRGVITNLMFAAGTSVHYVRVPILGDTRVEGDERFLVTISSTEGAPILDSSGTVTIRDDEGELSAPTIFRQPMNQLVNAGSGAMLNVGATGFPQVVYQWFGGIAGDLSRPVSTATNATFVSEPLQAATNYWVRVSNGAGTVESMTASIQVQGGTGGTTGGSSTGVVTGGTGGTAGAGSLELLPWEIVLKRPKTGKRVRPLPGAGFGPLKGYVRPTGTVSGFQSIFVQMAVRTSQSQSNFLWTPATKVKPVRKGRAKFVLKRLGAEETFSPGQPFDVLVRASWDFNVATSETTSVSISAR